ncbi:MAG TPA: hypothetical protein EYN66_15890 [Myxococcales bacterium]|nr:hypothetical protein [Myxococcales bacterium]
MSRALLFSLLLSFLVCGCGKNAALQEKLAIAQAESAAAGKAKQEAANKAAAEKHKRETAEAQKLKDERARIAALMPDGNTQPDAKVALTPVEKQLLEFLKKAESFKKVARHPKVKSGSLQPFLLRALTHMDSNVRTQAPRAFIINKVHNEEVTQGWTAALKNEASSIVLENWAYDLRLYKDEATLPALHRAFKVAQTEGARGNIAETLMELKYEAARDDIHNALAATNDIMGKVYLISALKRFPAESSKDVVSTYVNHDNKLLAKKARECLAAIEMADVVDTKKK